MSSENPARQDQRNNLTEAPIVKALLTLSWPIVLSNLLQTSYNLVDAFWVGKLGPAAFAAISIGFPIVFLLISVGAGFTVAGTALVAQHVGAKRHEAADRAAGQTLAFTLLFAVVIGIIGFFFSDTLLGWMGAQEAYRADAVAYMKIIFGGVPFMFGFFLFQALLRGSGDTLTPMKLMVTSTVFNILLDPFLIFGWGPFPELGVQGAAWATILSRGGASVVGVYLLFSGTKGIQLKPAYLRPEARIIKQIVSIGTPSAIEQSTLALAQTFMTSAVAGFGTFALAAFGIGNRIASLIFMPSMGLAQANTAMVGQNLGGGKPERAEKAAWTAAGLAFTVMIGLGVMLFLWPEPLVNIFIEEKGTAVLDMGSQYVRIASFGYAFMALMSVINGGFRGAGHTRTAMVFSIISLWVIRVPLAYTLPGYLSLGTSGIWWAVAISNIGGGLLAAAWFRRGTWKKGIKGVSGPGARPGMGPMGGGFRPQQAED